jgi:hypothetical protein
VPCPGAPRCHLLLVAVVSEDNTPSPHASPSTLSSPSRGSSLSRALCARPNPNRADRRFSRRSDHPRARPTCPRAPPPPGAPPCRRNRRGEAPITLAEPFFLAAGEDADHHRRRYGAPPPAPSLPPRSW